jgi:hypothetical protein
MAQKPAKIAPQGLSQEELEAQQASDLPDREAMTTLLDLDANLDLALDLAAPIDAAVAANANAAIPLDASVGANVLSVNSVAVSSADQDAPITQSLNGIANATATQDATIEQGDDMSENVAPPAEAGASASTGTPSTTTP